MSTKATDNIQPMPIEVSALWSRVSRVQDVLQYLTATGRQASDHQKDLASYRCPIPEYKPNPASLTPVDNKGRDTYSILNSPVPGNKVALAVASMRDHMTDEGWQIMDGLRSWGYMLAGHNLTTIHSIINPDNRVTKPIANLTDVRRILNLTRPDTVVVQDKREWDTTPSDFRDPDARFENITALKDRPDIFKVTILKDAHSRPDYHAQSAKEMGCHAWIVYYDPEIVCHLAPYVRKQHVIRTYHSLDKHIVPKYEHRHRSGCLLSGAISNVYPLRRSLLNGLSQLPHTSYLKHPGYHRNGCATPKFLQTLSNYRVAICTSSIYGYLLRKIVEATACGCMVITNLPKDEVVPWIDENLLRVPTDASPKEVARVLEYAYSTYNPDKQRDLSNRATSWYDYHQVGRRLAYDIEAMRLSYNQRLGR